jgi:hypothetical protein
VKGGDISNGVPPRVLVHLDVITVRGKHEETFLRFFKRERERRFFDKVALNALWRYSVRHELVLELFDTDISQRDMDRVIDDLDRLTAHPFRSGTVYPEVRVLVSDILPYRHDILGVIDLPERGLRYGSKWIDLTKV